VSDGWAAQLTWALAPVWTVEEGTGQGAEVLSRSAGMMCAAGMLSNRCGAQFSRCSKHTPHLDLQQHGQPEQQVDGSQGGEGAKHSVRRTALHHVADVRCALCSGSMDHVRKACLLAYDTPPATVKVTGAS